MEPDGFGVAAWRQRLAVFHHAYRRESQPSLGQDPVDVPKREEILETALTIGPAIEGGRGPVFPQKEVDVTYAPLESLVGPRL